MSNNTIEKKRVVINKPSEKECNICHGRFSLYSFSSHIKHVHQLTSDDYASKYGEFRKPTRPPTNRNIKHLICQLCNNSFPSVGMFTHLRDTHAVTVDTYVNQYGEYRPSKLRQIEYVERLKVIDANDKQICVICHSEFASGNLLGYHVKNIHNLTKKDYVLNYIFKGVRPLCECGCQRKVKILSYPPYKVDFISGHNSIGEGNVMFGKHFSVESKKKMSLKAIDRINSGIKKTIDTEPELKFKSILEFYNVTFIHPHSVDLGNRVISVDFYLPEKDLLVEIDGEYWHPEKIEDLNFHILPNVISDKQREVVENMVHIRSLDLKIFDQFKTKEQVLDFIANFSNSNCMGELRYKQKIINKEYFTTCLQNKGKPYVKSYIWLLLKFLRTFQPTLPHPDLEENLSEVIDRMKKMDLGHIYDIGTKQFSNNISVIGHNYLKHYFHSYWKTKFNGNPSPKEAWLDDKIMKEVIEYRIGYNNIGEVFDFSLHQMVRGLSARRITASFFKPLLAAAIYKYYLGDIDSPVVLDPCCGFGGRLLGFKSQYPNGKYIGCEPNIETYNELVKLATDGNWKNVEIHNCKFEDFKLGTGTEIDLVFTSIPYYDVEIYSNPVTYQSFEDWRNTFIKSIEECGKKYKSCYINVPSELCEKLGWNNNVDGWIISNRSHFDKRDGKKREPIVKL